jgi:hypothetical protein
LPQPAQVGLEEEGLEPEDLEEEDLELAVVDIARAGEESASEGVLKDW